MYNLNQRYLEISDKALYREWIPVNKITFHEKLSIHKINLNTSEKKVTKEKRDFNLNKSLKKEKEVDDFEVMPEVEDFIINRLPYYPSDEEVIEMIKDGTIPTTIRK